MEQNINNMDQLLKKKFEQFQPPPPNSVWKGVKSGIPVASKGFIAQLFSSKYFLPIAAASVIIIIGTIGLSSLMKKNAINDPELNKTETIISQQNQSSKDTNAEINDIVKIADTDFNATAVPSPDAENQLTLSEETGVPLEETSKAISSKTQNTSENTQNHDIHLDILSVETPQDQAWAETSEETYNIKSDDFLASPTNPNPNLYNTERFSNNPLSTLPPIMAFRIDITKKQSSIKTITSDQLIVNYGPLMSSKWDLGLFYFREWIYYPEDKDIVNHKNSHSFELTGRYHFSEFFIQSGLGVAISEDDGDCQIDYKEYELTGTYEDVYDVTFDSTNQGMVPIFHTQTIEVYDTLYQRMYTPMDHKYTYIQIPLLVGYEQSFAGRFFFNLKLGPILSIMVGDNESEIDYPTGDLEITSIQKPLPTRVKTSFQFMLGTGIGYNISNHVALTVEPAFKYYLGSGYKSTDMATTHPYSVGLRGGLIYRF